MAKAKGTAAFRDHSSSRIRSLKAMAYVSSLTTMPDTLRTSAVPRNASARRPEKRVGGRKSHAELWPEWLRKHIAFRRAKGKAACLSYREISARVKVPATATSAASPQPTVTASNDRGITAAA